MNTGLKAISPTVIAWLALTDCVAIKFLTVSDTNGTANVFFTPGTRQVFASFPPFPNRPQILSLFLSPFSHDDENDNVLYIFTYSLCTYEELSSTHVLQQGN